MAFKNGPKDDPAIALQEMISASILRLGGKDKKARRF
jgi:hypothetical protein